MSESEISSNEQSQTATFDEVSAEAYRIGYIDGQAKMRGNFLSQLALSATETVRKVTSAPTVAIGACVAYATVEINTDFTNKAWSTVEPVFSSLGRMF